LVVAYCLVQQLLLELRLLGYVFAPDRTQATITRFKGWMSRRWRTTATIGAVVIGAWLLARGLITLL
jgi:Sap, sulfolipid-1-addressing protein